MIVKNGLGGLILVIGVLFLFLNARAGFWVTVGIPVSFLLGLAIFYVVFGFGISIIALIGFIMALGIVVDDAIVVGEDIVSHHENGFTPAEAAVAARVLRGPMQHPQRRRSDNPLPSIEMVLCRQHWWHREWSWR